MIYENKEELSRKAKIIKYFVHAIFIFCLSILLILDSLFISILIYYRMLYLLLAILPLLFITYMILVIVRDLRRGTFVNRVDIKKDSIKLIIKQQRRVIIIPFDL